MFEQIKDGKRDLFSFREDMNKFISQSEAIKILPDNNEVVGN
jgi:hypothetical protein